jgi:hypothetical protein
MKTTNRARSVSEALNALEVAIAAAQELNAKLARKK